MDDLTTADGAGGPAPPPEPARVDPIAGEFVTDTLLEYDGGRQVTVYVPPDPPEAVVFGR
jgi:hypothetical protein